MRNQIQKLEHDLANVRFAQEKLGVQNHLEIARIERNLSLLEEEWASLQLAELALPNPQPKPNAQQQCPLPWWLVPLSPDDILVSKGVIEDQETHVRRPI